MGDTADEPTPVVVASADAGTRAQVSLTLGGGRFEVREAVDTETAIVEVATHRPPLLVLDVRLPGAGAAALARTLRSQPETATTRILLLIGRGDAGAMTDGVDGTLAVPFTAFALLHKVEALLAPAP